MKQYKLTNKDFILIKDFAHREWLNREIKEDNFHIECYTYAVIRWLNSKKLILKDGKLYESETN
jgi:hypothetical protein